MTRFIKGMLNKFEYTEASNSQNDWVQWTDKELEDAQYTLHCVRVCRLVRKSNKLFKKTQCKLFKSDAIMVNVGDNWFMDIETGRYYEMATEVESTGTTYVSCESPLYYDCYDTVKSKKLQPNDKFTARELRSIYQEHHLARGY